MNTTMARAMANESWVKLYMRFMKEGWEPTGTASTTRLGYWLQWQVFLCALWILLSISVSLYLIIRTKNSRKPGKGSGEQTELSLYADECWKPCLKQIHPFVLLLFRVTAFFMMLSILVVHLIVNGGPVLLYYYTQWTFSILTIYFGLGSVLSAYGCYHNVDGEKLGDHVRQEAGIWGYIFQVMYQTSAGAVMLTDCIYWLILIPYFTERHYAMPNSLMLCIHSVNAALLVIEILLNSMRFPMHRIAYFFLWTSMFVIFQWIIHSCVSVWWPYPFLDLSSRMAPLWYICVGAMHIPCYGAVALFVKVPCGCCYIYSTRYLPNGQVSKVTA